MSSAPSPYRGYVNVQQRGLISLPAQLRQRLGLDRPGTQVELVEREDGVVELRPVVAVPADQAWFWEEQWQAGEKRVNRDLAAGKVTVHDSAEDFLAHLDALEK